ncbi:hypothetical protein B0H14DRAFT_3536479 [Mycena olivaceomarginata]|nr:hypothetical protein B0H14DRAFT_3536479 [Mycena olivaceomarginata]
MPRAGTAARRRARQGKSPGKPGRTGWVHGTKLPFLEKHREEYLAAAEIKGTGAFYEKVAHLYLRRYGYHTPWDGDLDSDQDVASDVDADKDIDDLDPEEAATRTTYFKLLKGKIGTWYNTTPPPAPKKLRIVHFYSRRFYHERVKDRVTARWAALSKLPNPPKEITVRNQVTKECWEAEDPAFQDEVRAALKSEHKAAQEAYATATSGEAPTTAEEYDIALNNAAYYLQPFADAAHKRYGMNVAILLCGPIPERGGRIEVRSIHAGTSNGLTPRVWSDYDRGGFDAAQRSFIEFSHQCFTEEECRARSLGGRPMAQDNKDEDNSPRGASQPMPIMSSPPPPPLQQTSESQTTQPGTQPPTSTMVPPSPEREGLAPSQQAHTLFDGLEQQHLQSGGEQLQSFDAPKLYFDGYGGSEDFMADPLGIGDDVDLSKMLPSQMSLGDLPRQPKIGRALRAELARLSETEQEWEIAKLRMMTEEEVERQNEAAHDRLMFARLERGVPANIAFDLSSDPEDNGEDEGAAALADDQSTNSAPAPTQ